MLYIVLRDAVIVQYIEALESMPQKKRRTKTAVMTLRVDPKVKAAAELAAERDHRSLTSLIEVLILNHCKSLNIQPPTSSPKETL